MEISLKEKTIFDNVRNVTGSKWDNLLKLAVIVSLGVLLGIGIVATYKTGAMYDFEIFVVLLISLISVRAYRKMMNKQEPDKVIKTDGKLDFFDLNTKEADVQYADAMYADVLDEIIWENDKDI